MASAAAARRARVFAVLGLVLAVAALATAYATSLGAVVLGAAAIVCAAVAWLRGDPSARRGRRLAGASLVIALLAGILAAATTGVDGGVVPSPTQTLVRDHDPDGVHEVVVDGVDVIVHAARDSAHAGQVYVPVTVANLDRTTRTFTVRLVAHDPDGRQVATDSVAVHALAPGHEIALTAFGGTPDDTLRDARVTVAGLGTA